MLVAFTVIFPRFFEILARRDRVFTAMFGNILPDGSSSVCFICKDVTAEDIHFFQQFHGDYGVIRLTAGQDEIHELTVTVDQSMDFRVLSAAVSADILPVFCIYSPFFAPVLCGCALIEVLSMFKFFQFSFYVQFPEDAVQRTVIPPFAETAVHNLVGTEAFGKITPSGSAACDPEDCVQHQTVILWRTPHFRMLDHIFDLFPLFVAYFVSFLSHFLLLWLFSFFSIIALFAHWSKSDFSDRP